MKRFLLILILAAGMVFSGCQPGSGKAEGINSDSQSYGLYNINYAPYEGGALVRMDQVLQLDRDTNTVVPLCTRKDCGHKAYGSVNVDGVNCPAIDLAKKAMVYAVYEGKIWYVVVQDEKWEFWTADMNNENQEKQFEVALGSWNRTASPSLFYRGYFYTIQSEKASVQDRMGGEYQNRLISVRLRDGQVEALTEWMDLGLELAGVHEGDVYYGFGQSEDNRFFTVLRRMSIETGETEDIAKSEYGLNVAMNEDVLVYALPDHAAKKEIFLLDLESGKTKLICETDDVTLSGLSVSQEKVIWNCQYSGEDGIRASVYDIGTGELRETEPYQGVRNQWTWAEDGWFFSMRDVAGVNRLIYYIDEADFWNGGEGLPVFPADKNDALS
jgi:hypothetical protein